MLNTRHTLYSYNDIMIKPAVVSQIDSRKECNPYIEENGKQYLPIFTAPMSTVVSDKNYNLWEENYIMPIMPRNINLVTRNEYAKMGKWAAFSLNEFYEMFCNPYGENTSSIVWRALIDVANGHMQRLYDAVKQSKQIHGDKIQIMIGNIANPETYKMAYDAGCWGVRVGVGGGSGCLSSSNLGLHYPMASLISETACLKKDIYQFNNTLNKKWDEMPKIIADGNIKGYQDVNKALALGADYVMIGSLFASLEESAGKVVHENGIRCKEFYGMASREGQIAINGKKTKTSEGIKKYLPIIGTLPQWSENMRDYLRSVMSYCNINDISDFNADNVETIVVSYNTMNRINK